MFLKRQDYPESLNFLKSPELFELLGLLGLLGLLEFLGLPGLLALPVVWCHGRS